MPTYKSYITGFLASLALTLIAYFMVSTRLLTGGGLIATIFAMAFIQLVCQLIFFLHLGSGSRWNLAILVSTVGIIFLIIAGSLWIMEKLQYNMSPDQMNQYMQDQGSF